jgi:uncharacterized membrane protein
LRHSFIPSEVFHYNLGHKPVTIEDKEKEELEKKIRRQNRIVIILGIVVILIFVVVGYYFRNVKFPFPTSGYP